MQIVDSANLGKAERIDDARGRYIEFCKSTISSRISLKDLKLVVDCAHGATYHIAPDVFEELGAEVITLGTEPDGLNINRGCGATDTAALQAAVLQHKADLGIALDGDGDRVIMVDHSGAVVDGDELLYIIAKSRYNAGKLHGPVVGTLMSNLGLELGLKKLSINFMRAKVGDRYVLEMLQQHGGLIGGESSGHVICLDRTSTGDGIISALQVLASCVDENRSLTELKTGMQKFPQRLVNVPLTRHIDVLMLPEVQNAVAVAEKTLADKGRVLLRPSGTEPLIRVMVEGLEGDVVDTVAQQLAETVQNAGAQA